jgi:hypothetical protein
MKVYSHFKFISAILFLIIILTSCSRKPEDLKFCTDYHINMEVDNPVLGSKITQYFIKDCNERYANIDGIVCIWNDYNGTPFTTYAEAEFFKDKIQNNHLIIKN